jgi:hypothetical protein
MHTVPQRYAVRDTNSQNLGSDCYPGSAALALAPWVAAVPYNYDLAPGGGLHCYTLFGYLNFGVRIPETERVDGFFGCLLHTVRPHYAYLDSYASSFGVGYYLDFAFAGRDGLAAAGPYRFGLQSLAYGLHYY